MTEIKKKVNKISESKNCVFLTLILMFEVSTPQQSNTTQLVCFTSLQVQALIIIKEKPQETTTFVFLKRGFLILTTVLSA